MPRPTAPARSTGRTDDPSTRGVLMVGTFIAIVVIGMHVAAWGLIGYRGIKVRLSDPVAVLATCLGLGVVLFGWEVILLGSFHGLRPAVLGASELAVLLLLPIAIVKSSKSGPTPLLPIWTPSIRQQPLTSIAVAAMLLLIFASGFRPPLYPDEREYHWPAPLFWAAHGGWLRSPYRHTNGPILMHALYTVAAVWHSSTAAHWSHSILLGCLLLSAAALARSAGAPGLLAAAACLSIPSIVDQASVAYTDVAAAALALAAFVPLLCESPDIPSTSTLRAGNLLSSGMLLSGAFSIKSFVVAAAPLAVIFALWDPHRRGASAKLAGAGLILLPIVVAAAIWSIRTHAMTGSWWDTQGIIVHDEASPAWQQGWAVGRIPTAGDLLRVPLIPLLVPMLGQREPYGGRIGPLFLLAWPAIGWYVWRRVRTPGVENDRLPWLLAAAGVYFVLLSPFLVKTRFHNFVWSASAVLAVVACQRLRRVLPPAWGRTLAVCFALAIGFGMFDASRVLLRGWLTPFP